jgi:hypothetical protein
VSGLEILVIQKSDACAAELQDRVTDHFKHAAHLLVSSLVKQDFIPRVGLRLMQLGYLSGRGARAIVECNSASQSLDPGISRDAFYLDLFTLTS